MWVIVSVKTLLTTKKEWFVLSEFRYNKSSTIEGSNFIGCWHRERKSSPKKCLLPTQLLEFRVTRWVENSAAYWVVRLARQTRSWLKKTCSLDSSDLVVIIEEDSVWTAKAVVFRFKSFFLHLALEARLKVCWIVASSPRLNPAAAPSLFVFACIGPLQTAFLEMLETRISGFSSLTEARRDACLQLVCFAFLYLELAR